MWLFLTAALVIFAFALFRFPRQTLYVLGGLIAIATVGWLYLQSENNKWREEQQRREAREASVAVSVAYDSKNCPPEFPLVLMISNGSSSVVHKVWWNYEAFAPGRSTDLVMHPLGFADRILQPNTTVTLCYKLPELSEKIDPATLQWRVERSSVTFAGG
jgi:hypothetical protein